MKKVLLIVIVFGLLFVSCKKDNHTTPSPKVTIVGKWQYKKTRSLHIDSEGTILSEDEVTDYTDADYVQYNSDGTGISNQKGIEMDFTYNFDGTFDTEYLLPRSAGDKPIIYTIFTLTSTTLTRHIQTHDVGEFSTIRDEDFVKLSP